MHKHTVYQELLRSNKHLVNRLFVFLHNEFKYVLNSSIFIPMVCKAHRLMWDCIKPLKNLYELVFVH